MRSFFGFTIIIILFFSCDDERIYERNIDFNSPYWLISEKPEFEFEISDTAQPYNLYCNVRNSLDYPFARIFVTYYLQDSSTYLIEKNLIGQLLFDDKTGKPHGNSGLGDIYDQRIQVKKNFRFKNPGKYRIKFEQFMRTDTLSGILAVGLRVEKSSPVH